MSGSASNEDNELIMTTDEESDEDLPLSSKRQRTEAAPAPAPAPAPDHMDPADYFAQ